MPTDARSHACPPGWHPTVLCDVADVNPESLGIGTPPDLRFRYIDLSAVVRGHIRWTDVREEMYRTSPSRARRVVAPGDVLFGTVRPALQSHGFVEDQGGARLVASTGFAVVRARPRQSHPRFLYHIMLGNGLLAETRRVEVGSNYPAVNESDVRQFPLDCPPVPEQRRIAEILDTLDEAIRATEQVIAKLQQVKQGLLHDLLTRGIDEHGELRDPGRHPEQFKDSPLGLVPRDWIVQSVEELLADVDPAMRSGPFGSALLKDELVSTGVPLLGIDNVHVERFVREFTRFVTPRKAVELSRYRVRPRDVMITIMGTVGRCALVPDDIGEALSSKHVWTLTFDQTRYSPYLACLQFNYAPWVLAHFGQDEQGGIMSAIRSETLRTTQLPVPPPDEQRRIVSVLSDLDHRLAGEALDADKLRTLKHGLMDDLLTGRVRVPVLKEASP